jgi:hypothetical protein
MTVFGKIGSAKNVLIPLGCAALLALGTYRFGWQGFALVATGLAMWLLMHFTRALRVLKQAAKRPIGHVGSAVMMNAKLKPGMRLLQVIALTRSLGQRVSEPDIQPEIFVWRDAGDSQVTCTFITGKLTQHALLRPQNSE